MSQPQGPQGLTKCLAYGRTSSTFTEGDGRWLCPGTRSWKMSPAAALYLAAELLALLCDQGMGPREQEPSTCCAWTCACTMGRTAWSRVKESRDPATAWWVGGLNSVKAAFGDFQMKARHTHCVPQANCERRGAAGDELVAGLGCLAKGQCWPDHSRF